MRRLGRRAPRAARPPASRGSCRGCRRRARSPSAPAGSQAQDLGALGGSARARWGAPPRPSRRRDPARGAPGRADLPQRRARRLAAHGGIRGLASAPMEPIPAPDAAVTDGGSGFAKAVRAAWPRAQGPEMRGSTRSARSKGARRQSRGLRRAGRCAGSRSTPCTSRRCTGRSCGAGAASTGAASGPTSPRTPRSPTGGGPAPARGSPKASRPLSSPVSAGTLLTCPDPEPTEAPLDRQQDRGRRQRPAQGGSPQPQRADVPEAREGCALAVPRASRRRGDRRGEAGDHAEGRRNRPAPRRLPVIPEARRWEAGTGRRGRLGRAPPQGPLPVPAGSA